MGQKYYRNIDLLANQLLNSRLHNISTTNRVALGATLTSISKGYMVYDTDLLTPYFWNGTQWVAAGGGGSTPNLQQVLTAGRTELNSTSNFRITLNEPVAGDETKVFYSEYDGKSWIKSELFLSNVGSEPYFNFGVQEKIGSSSDDYVELRPSGAEFYRTGSTYSSKIAIPFNNTANYTNTLPLASGTLALTVNGQSADSAGAITIPVGTGTVTNVGAGTGMSFTAITTSGNVAIDTAKVPYYASAPSNGLLKYTSGTWGVDTNTYLTSAVTSVAALTLGTTGTDLTSTVANGTTTPVITLNVPDASATARGVINTTTQTIAGQKTFDSDLKVNTYNPITVGRGPALFSFNIAIGYQALNVTTGNSNMAVGDQALLLNTSGTENTAIGQFAMTYNTTGNYNTAVGGGAGQGITTGQRNTAIGWAAMYDSNPKDGFGNTAMGWYAGRKLAGQYNTGIGYEVFGAGAGITTITGTYNTAIGTNAGTGITTGNYNTVVGAQTAIGNVSNNVILADGQGNVRFKDDGTNTILSRLAGTGTRMVVADATGTLSTQAVPLGTVTGVTATSPITSSGGTAPVISTSMSTNKLVGRSTAGTGVMEEITIGTGLSLSGGTLNATGTSASVGFEMNFLLMGA